jgi:m7GpppX diphosphatase
MVETTTSTAAESKSDAEALIPLFQFEKILNHGLCLYHVCPERNFTHPFPSDQSGRRLTLLGSINTQPTLLIIERSALPSDPSTVTTLLSSLTNTTNLGANDIYRWYLSTLHPTPSLPSLKLNLIHPCTPKHISKYSSQRLRTVTETPSIYHTHLHPWISTQRAQGRLDWIFNILDGRTEQEDVILRSNWSAPDQSGFLLLPDLNWDRSTASALHLLALVQRRDIWSLRDLKKKHVPWLRGLRVQVVRGAAGVFESGRVEEDELKCYVHYQPTYYHFHVHVVHVMLEAQGGTQNVGKAWELGVLIAMLEEMEGDGETGLDGVDFNYVVGEESELWKGLWGKLKAGEEVTLNQE